MQTPDKTQRGERLHHSDTDALRKRFDKAVKRMTQMFEGTFTDSFDIDNVSDHLVNFASGVVTTPAVEGGKSTKSLRQRQSNGNKLYEAEDTWPLKSFYDPLPV